MNDAVRFLEQATWGPTDAQIARVQQIGIADYLDEQLVAAPTLYPDLPAYPSSSAVGCPDGSPPTCYRDNYTMYPLQVAFFLNALNAPDQLRQRVAFALHQILVVSGVAIQQPSSMAPYLNVLARGAFGSYRQLLEDVTLNPAMGDYLDMVNNDKPNAAGTITPNENYAREVLQLFSIGLHLLNPDGTPKLDAGGQPVPAYDEEVIEGFAYTFTGWTYATLPGATPARHNPRNYLAPMWLYRDANGVDSNHDKGPKELLSYPGAVHPTLPAGQSGDVDLAQALDNIFHHPNVGPFLGKQLIQHLVTSNPSPSYVARVAAVFDDDGQGVRGNLKAVVRAILLDREARGSSVSTSDYGHLREPARFVTGLLRAFNATSDGILNDQSTRAMGQSVFLSPSVFNYYPHEYVVPGTLVQGPEFGIQSSSAALARANFVNTIVFSKVSPPAPATGTSIDLANLQALASSPSKLVDYLDTLLLHGTMSRAMRNAVLDAVNAVTSTDTKLRAQTALYLVAASGQYQVQR